MSSRDSLLKELEQTLIKYVDQEEFEDCIYEIISILRGYSVDVMTSEIAVYQGKNEKLLQQYAACLFIDGRSPKTIKSYMYRLQNMFKTLQKDFTDIGVNDIRWYLGQLKLKGNANSTLEGVRSYISAFYRWMFLENIIQKNPCETIKPINYNIKHRAPFTAVEIEKIKNACKTSRERAIVEILLTTGIRVSELEAMDIKDVDLEKRTVYVKHGKGDKDRTTFISAVAAYHFKNYLKTRNDKNEALFLSKTGRLHPGGIRYILKEIENRCGVEGIHPHRFRRTFATSLNRKGMPIQHIQKLLGHSSIDTTMIYVSIDRNQIQSEYTRMIGG